jgi:hypothetical protein
MEAEAVCGGARATEVLWSLSPLFTLCVKVMTKGITLDTELSWTRG